MNKFRRITALGFGEADLPNDVLERLRDLGEEVAFIEPAGAPFECDTTDALLVPLGATIDDALISALPALRYVGILGTGLGGIDLRACAAQGIAVCNVPGYSTDAVAEFCLAMLLDHHRRIFEARSRAEAGRFDDRGLEGTELRSLRFGIVGAGAIGSRFAELVAGGLRADAVYWSRRRKADLEGRGVRYATLDQLAAESDVVSVHVASNDSTRAMLGRAFLQALPAGATIVASVPLDVFDVNALADQVVGGRLSLLTDHPDGVSATQLATLRSSLTTVVYPSIAYVTTQASKRKHREFVGAIEAFLAGERYNRVEPE